MSTVAGERGAGDVTRVSDKPPAGPAPKVRVTWARVLIAAAVLVVLLSLVRVLSGATDLTSAGAVSAALLLAVPIAMAGLGGLWAERAGVVNIGLEGMMILGTWGAGWAGYQWGPWAGVLAALVFGAIGGLLHAVATVLFNVDHIVSGVAINILAFGATQFLSNAFFTKVEGGSTKQSPTVDDIGTVSVPLVGDGLRSLETQQWFLVSDVAGITRGLLTNVSWITLIAVLLLPLSFFVLWRTASGCGCARAARAPLLPSRSA
jgi:simple sugar transport system permease protein